MFADFDKHTQNREEMNRLSQARCVFSSQKKVLSKRIFCCTFRGHADGYTLGLNNGMQGVPLSMSSTKHESLILCYGV